MNIYKKSIRCAAVLLFVLFCLIPAAAADWSSVLETAASAIARITVTDQNGAIVSQGTGFAVVDSQGNEVLVSNAHVVRDARFGEDFRISAEFLYEGNEEQPVYTGKILRFDAGLDLCTIRLDRSAPAILILSDNEPPGLMTEILVAGYPLGMNFKATPGYVQAFQQVEKRGVMLDLSSVLAPGNSGGPVLNSGGQVIGVATATIPGYNFNLAIPAGNLNSFLSDKSGLVNLTLSSLPADSWVFLDGSYKGKTPLSLELPDRVYQLRVEREGFNPELRSLGPWDGENDPSVQIILTEKIDPNPLVMISTVPAGAEIFINNQLVGISPLEIHASSGRILRIRFELKGYREVQETYRVTDANRQEIAVPLKKKILFW